ncbi:MAG TPA: hypothetical protein VFK03_00285, partial [Candidatus Saccharimonadales bacterium]|nr:hypothetical protein [Candidatus Saccharimonadales bacterium]
KDSIAARGLINQIDVAKMNREQLETYIDFVNRTWQTEVAIDDYDLQQQPDGYYYVVVAGHSRTEAVSQLQAENEAGYEYAIIAKVHEVTTPEEIITLQLDENLHSQPAQEQQAVAIVETYRFGLESGSWKNKTEFMKRSKGKFSKKALNDAIGFARLPLEGRDFVFSGEISYSAGVALGRASETVLDHLALKLGFDFDVNDETDNLPVLDKAYRETIGIHVAHIRNHKLNGPAAKKYILGQVNLMREEIAKLRNLDGDEGAALFDYDMVSAAEAERKRFLAELNRRHNQALIEMRSSSVDNVEKVIALHKQLVGEDGVEELEVERDHRRSAIGVRATELEAIVA